MRLLAVALISAAALAYEVLLTRLFAIIQWHHFAYMIISVALLGYGASGSFIALAQDRLLAALRQAAFATLAVLFGIAALACFALAQRLPFNPLEIVWDPRQLLYLLALSGLLALPFFCAASCDRPGAVALPGARSRGSTAPTCSAPARARSASWRSCSWRCRRQALELVAALGPLAAALVLAGRPARRAWPRAAALAALALLLAATPAPLERPPALAVQGPEPGADGARRDRRGGALEPARPRQRGAQQDRPLRHAPGQSLASATEPAAQIGLFVDGEGPSPITAFDGDLARLAYLDLTARRAALPPAGRRRRCSSSAPAAAPTCCSRSTRGAARIDAVELNPQLAGLVATRYAGFAGGVYQRPAVALHTAEARRFVATSDRRYDLIQLPLLNSFAATSAGNVSLHESFVYTVEAFADYLAHLAPGGYLAISRWLKLPPRDSLKLFLTALTALERAGVAAPGSQLALLRSWDTTLLLVRNGPLGADQIRRIRAFADARSFDLAYLPGLRADEANRYNLLPQPWFFDATRALAGPEREDFVARYKFSLAPATDERPYFFDFFRWRALPELWQVALQSGAGLLDWGYLILTATLLQAALLSVVLILLPLWLGLRTRRAYASRWRVVAYFGAIGLAFLFVEIAAIQRFTLFLGHPLYAIAVVLAGFLIFAGAGQRLLRRPRAPLPTRAGARDRRDRAAGDRLRPRAAARCSGRCWRCRTAPGSASASR